MVRQAATKQKSEPPELLVLRPPKTASCVATFGARYLPGPRAISQRCCLPVSPFPLVHPQMGDGAAAEPVPVPVPVLPPYIPQLPAYRAQLKL
jgi:hypothetical protein